MISLSFFSLRSTGLAEHPRITNERDQGARAVPVRAERAGLGLRVHGSVLDDPEPLDWSEAAVAREVAAVPRYEALNLDIWLGVELNGRGLEPTDFSTGLALAFPILNRHLRPSLLAAPDRIGAGLAATVVPVIEVSIGAGVVWNLDNGDRIPVVYGSLYKF